MDRAVRHLLVIFATCLTLGLTACNGSDGSDAASLAQQPSALPVSVIMAAKQDLPIINNLPGRVAPTRIAEVRPRVSGIVEKRVFKQGSLVKAGAVLYKIDSAQFEVQVESARATLERAKAVQLQARQQADRQARLRETNVTSKQQYDTALAELAQADADVAAAEANLKAATLNLQYCKVKAPIDGRIGRAQITEGALVIANDPQSLATIQQLDPIYVDFTQSANELLQLRQAMEAASGVSRQTSAELRLDNGAAYSHSGKLLFSEASVEKDTGQITLRAEFPNPDNFLLPGMYVRILIQQGVERGALAVPEQAVQRDASGNAKLYVVKEDSTVELRSVTTARIVDNRLVISKGLKEGERVVVEGFQKIQSGTKVVAQPWQGSQENKLSASADGTRK